MPVLQHLLLASLFLLSSTTRAADLDDARKLLRAGKYQECLTAAETAIADRSWSDDWRVLKIETEMAIGDYAAAHETMTLALKRYSTDIRLRWLAHALHKLHGETDLAKQRLMEIEKLAQERPWRYSDAESRCVLGRYFLSRGADPRQVLELFYDRAKKDHPQRVESYLAAGDLALDKSDYQVAAREFRQALKVSPDSADAHYGLAMALADSDSEQATKLLEKALTLNPRHIRSLLFLVDRHIDGERHDEARATIDKILAVNPEHALAWALLAVIAHLEADAEAEAFHRRLALGWWSSNPEVDHLIGRKLSRKYRFAEGADYQRRALKFDADYLPAKMQLSQDLLRLGDEKEGWRLADEVYSKDGYNVLAHNLVTLRDRIDKFRTLEADGLIVRMDAREASIYGDDVVELLSRARVELRVKYDVQLREPVIVEIFPKQQDFAIRTFGLPGGIGFLGVCFGRVITANSPASQSATPANWKAVLWHEYCHVITLQKTANKMPRWLSEGISVYEERVANPTWGQSMTPQYREMILDDETLTPVSELSSAFLSPPSPMHLQFAYYESSLVVEHLVEKYGFPTLLKILDDLRVGMPINDALGRHTGSLAALNKEFAEYARGQARKLGEKLDWGRDDLPEQADADDWAAWSKQHPDNYWGLKNVAQSRLAEKRWRDAIAPLKRIQELYPEDRAALTALARVYRELKETDAEVEMLERLAAVSNDAVDAYLRLMELAEQGEKWEKLAGYTEQMLAVNPLTPAVQRFAARAADARKQDKQATRAYRALLQLDPVDPAQSHFRLARLLWRQGIGTEAKRQVLMALEEAPRYRDAHRLLLEIVAENNKKAAGEFEAPPAPNLKLE